MPTECLRLDPLPCRLRLEDEEAESRGGDVDGQLLWEAGNLPLLLWEGNKLLWEGNLVLWEGKEHLLCEGNEGNCWCDTGEERTARLEIGENRGAGDALLVSRLLIDVGDSRWFLLELGDARAVRLGDARAARLVGDARAARLGDARAVRLGDARAARLEVRGARLRLLLRALRVSLGGSTWEKQL